jgi:hypothetical protein
MNDEVEKLVFEAEVFSLASHLHWVSWGVKVNISPFFVSFLSYLFECW